MIAGTPDRVLRQAVEHPRPPAEAINRPPATARPHPASDHPGIARHHLGTAHHHRDIGHLRFLLRGLRSSAATAVRRLPVSRHGHKHPNLVPSHAGRTQRSSIDRASATSTRRRRLPSLIPSDRHPKRSPLVDVHHRRTARYGALLPPNRHVNARSGVGADGSD